MTINEPEDIQETLESLLAVITSSSDITDIECPDIKL